MRDQLKALSKETLIYGTSTVIGRFLNFLLVPFYVNVLPSTAHYGAVTSLYTYIGFLTVIYPLGLEASYFRYGARPEGVAFDPAHERDTFSTPFLFVLALGCGLTALLMAAAPWLAHPVFFDPKIEFVAMQSTYVTAIRYGALILLFDALAVLPFAALRLEHQAIRFAAIRLAGIITTLALNFVFVLGMRLGIKGIFLANTLGSALVLILLLPTIAPRLVLRFDRPIFDKLFPFGLTNVPAYLSSMMVQVIDRPIVQAFLGLGVLGIYQANYRMGFIMMVFVSLFEYAWRPFFMRQALRDDAEARRIFARVFTLFMVISLLAFLGLSWALPYIVSVPVRGHRLLKETYLSGLPIIPVVLLAYVFQGMYTNFIAGIYIKEQNKSLPWITGMGAAINIAANFLLIPHLGIMGAALATLFAYMAMAGGIYFASQRAYPINYEWGKIGMLSLIVALAFVIDRVLVAAGITVFVPSAAIKIILFALSTAAVWRLGYMDV